MISTDLFFLFSKLGLGKFPLTTNTTMAIKIRKHNNYVPIGYISVREINVNYKIHIWEWWASSNNDDH